MRNRGYEQLKQRLIRAAVTKKVPIIGHFELTARCNLDCKMCYVHTQDNAAVLKRELSTQQWKHIFDEAYDAGMLYASLSGGECLIRKDFKELYLHLWNKQVMVAVMTNGTLLNEEYVEFFKTYKPEQIQISLYGSNEDGYLRVTGHKGFDKATEAIQALEAAGIDVRVTVTPSKYILDDYIPTLKICKEKNFFMSNGDVALIPKRDKADENDYYLTCEEAFMLSKQRAELYMELEPAECTPEPRGDMCTPPQKGLKCTAGTCAATVTWEGKMYPCVSITIGEGASLLEMSYAEAWEKTQLLAQQVVQGAECVGCAYDKTCPLCPALRLKDLQSGQCNPDMCELTRKLVAIGAKKLDQGSEMHE